VRRSVVTATTLPPPTLPSSTPKKAPCILPPSRSTAADRPAALVATGRPRRLTWRRRRNWGTPGRGAGRGAGPSSGCSTAPRCSQPHDKHGGGCKVACWGEDNYAAIVAEDNDAALVVEDNDAAIVTEPLLCKALDVWVVHCSLLLIGLTYATLITAHALPTWRALRPSTYDSPVAVPPQQRKSHFLRFLLGSAVESWNNQTCLLTAVETRGGRCLKNGTKKHDSNSAW